MSGGPGDAADGAPSVGLTVDGRPVEAVSGTTVAAALLNAGWWTLRRSVRGDARGPLCGMGSCHECRVEIDGVPHRRSCMVPVSEGMRVRTGSPSEAAVGLSARVPREVDVVEADVVVVGAGPAGIAAATGAAGGERQVVVLDEGAREGGQIWRHRRAEDLPRDARTRVGRLREAEGMRIIHGASVVGAPEPGVLLVERRGGGDGERDGRPFLVRWRRALVLAPGARERFLPFSGWTLPGVVGVGGAQALVKSGMDVRGARVVVAGTGPLLLPVAALLARQGASLRAVAEQASGRRVARFASGLLVREPGKLAEAIRYRAAFPAVRYRTGWWVRAAAGEGRVEEVVLTDGRAERTVPCDLLAVGYGLVPATELPRVLGCAVGTLGVTGAATADAGWPPPAVLVDEWQETTVPGIFCAGEATGVAGAPAALVEGAVAGLASTGRRDEARRLLAGRDRGRAFARRLERSFRPRPELHRVAPDEELLCRCEDVELGRARPFTTPRAAKLATRCGMGPCQGRVCGPAAAFLLGWDDDAVRPPVAPTRLDTLVQGGRPPWRAPPDPPSART